MTLIAENVPNDSNKAEGPKDGRSPGILTALTKVRPGEGTAVFLFATYAFLLLVCYYMLKTLREPLLLTHGSAESKSYAYAAIALILLFLVPAYAAVFRHQKRARILRWVTVLFLIALELFFFLGRSGANIGFAYYVFVGIFSVMMLAQFWAHAADSFDLASGKRLFPMIMLGASLGALVGPQLVSALFESLGPWRLMAVPMVLMVLTLPLSRWARGAIPKSCRCQTVKQPPQERHWLGGIAMVLRNRYLTLLAMLVMLLNCVNTTGEYVLTDLVLDHAHTQVAQDPEKDVGELIASFYGQFFLTVNVLAVILQLFLVGHVFRLIGVQGAVLLLPVVAIVGYGLVAFLPIFAVVRTVKIFENSMDYSLMNTARHALYLPVPPSHKFVGKTAIDTFFWRFGDVLQAGVIFVGLNWFDFRYQEFALLNMVLAIFWLLVAVRVGHAFGNYQSERDHENNESDNHVIRPGSPNILRGG